MEGFRIWGITEAGTLGTLNRAGEDSALFTGGLLYAGSAASCQKLLGTGCFPNYRAALLPKGRKGSFASGILQDTSLLSGVLTLSTCKQAGSGSVKGPALLIGQATVLH